MNKFLSIPALALALILSGCGAPPPPPKSAKNEIGNASSAMDTAKVLASRGLYEQSKTEYEHALDEISKGQQFAAGTELTQLDNMKKEARQKKAEMETKALIAGPVVVKAAPPVPETVKTEDPELARKKLEAAKAAALALENNNALTVAPKTKVKVQEPEDSGDVAEKKPKDKPADAPAETADAGKPKTDKSGIFPVADDQTPPFQVIKLQRFGKFVVGYCLLHNNTDNGKRVTVATFFKNRDNQQQINPLTTAAFPYEHFSFKVKDLIGDQSVRNLAPNAEEVGGHEFLQFVCVGEANNEESAKLITKVYVNVLFSDGTTVDGTSPETAAGSLNTLSRDLVKTPGGKK